VLAQYYEHTAALIGLLVFAFPGLTLLKVARRCKSNVLRGLLVLVGSLLTMIAAFWLAFGLYLSVFIDLALHWTLGFVGAAALIYIVFRSRSAPPSRLGHCRKCDYDLTGNTSGVCPECGLKTSRSAALPMDRAPDGPP